MAASDFKHGYSLAQWPPKIILCWKHELFLSKVKTKQLLILLKQSQKFYLFASILLSVADSLLNKFSPMLRFYAARKRHKTKGFMFSVGTEMEEEWAKIGTGAWIVFSGYLIKIFYNGAMLKLERIKKGRLYCLAWKMFHIKINLFFPAEPTRKKSIINFQIRIFINVYFFRVLRASFVLFWKKQSHIQHKLA